jgi:glycerophosphoryl diester phosphodiesterase
MPTILPFSQKLSRFTTVVLSTLLLLSLMMPSSCKRGELALDIQGHRGCRGLMPENSLPAFEKAWEIGANTLEMDVVVSKDRQVVVSHEAWFSHECCRDTGGRAITEANERQFNLYQMDYAEIERFDCGSFGHPRFPGQQKMKTTKPLLRDVFKLIEKKDVDNPLNRPRYNIEIKTEPGGSFNPPATEFVELVLAEIHRGDVLERCNIQSFDVEILKETRRQEKYVTLALLVDEGEAYKDKLAELGFYPEYLSPEFHLVDAQMLSFAAEKHMKVIPWTVNEVEDMEKLIDLGVPGIITDYPDRLVELLHKK